MFGKKKKRISIEPKAGDKYLTMNEGLSGEYKVKVLTRQPKGWTPIKGAMTAPKGYIWVSNNKSLLKGERKTALVQDPNYPKDWEKQKIEVMPTTSSKAPKKVAQKPAVKRSEPKHATPKKEPTSVKKPARAKKSAADKLLMHNDKDEMKVDSKKPIVINGANIKPKPVPKVLRRVAKSGGYTAWDDVKRNGKTFATEQEAKDYAADVLKKTGKIVPISPTDRQVTHTFKPEEEKKKK